MADDNQDWWSQNGTVGGGVTGTAGYQIGDNSPSWMSDPQYAGMNHQLAQLYAQNGVTPGGQGSGLTDWQYWNNKINTGDSNYFLGRLGDDLQGKGMDSPGAGGGSAMPLSGMNYQPLPSYRPPNAPQYQSIHIDPLNYSPMAAPDKLVLPTAQDVQNTPGYAFTRDQGLLGVQRSAAPNGIGGAAMQQGAQYASNLADTYYQNAVNNNLNYGQANFSNAFNVNQANAQNALNYYNASNNAALAASGLNLQGTNQQFQNTYMPSWNAYQSDVQQNQFGAQNALNLGQLVLQQGYLGLYGQNQNWNQGMAENQNAFNQYNTNQNDAFQQWLALAQMGYVGNPYA